MPTLAPNPAALQACSTSSHAAASSALPTLSATESRLFTDFVSCGYSNRKFLETHTDADFQTLYSSPAIQAHIEAATAHMERSARAQAAFFRQTVLEDSHSLTVNTLQPIEKRRNVTLLLRATALPILPLRTPRPTEPRTPPSDPSTTSPVARLAEPCPTEPRGADSHSPSSTTHADPSPRPGEPRTPGGTRPTTSPSPEGAQESQAPDNSAAQAQPNSEHPTGEGLPSPSSPRPAGRGARAAGEGGEGSPLSSSCSPSSPRASRGEVASRSEAGEGLPSPSSPLRGEVASQREAGEAPPSSTTSSNAFTTPETPANSPGGSQGGAPLASASQPQHPGTEAAAASTSPAASQHPLTSAPHAQHSHAEPIPNIHLPAASPTILARLSNRRSRHPSPFNPDAPETRDDFPPGPILRQYADVLPDFSDPTDRGGHAFLDIRADLPAPDQKLTPYRLLEALFIALRNSGGSSAPLLTDFLVLRGSERLQNSIRAYPGERFSESLRNYVTARLPGVASMTRAIVTPDPTDEDLFSTWHVEYLSCEPGRPDSLANFQLLVTLSRAFEPDHPHNYTPWTIDWISVAVDTG